MKTDEVCGPQCISVLTRRYLTIRADAKVVAGVYTGGFYLHATFSRCYANGVPVYEDF